MQVSIESEMDVPTCQGRARPMLTADLSTLLFSINVWMPLPTNSIIHY